MSCKTFPLHYNYYTNQPNPQKLRITISNDGRAKTKTVLESGWQVDSESKGQKFVSAHCANVS